jgi:hypothetical protein
MLFNISNQIEGASSILVTISEASERCKGLKYILIFNISIVGELCRLCMVMIIDVFH